MVDYLKPQTIQDLSCALLVCVALILAYFGFLSWCKHGDDAWREEMRLMDEERAAQEAREEAAKRRAELWSHSQPADYNRMMSTDRSQNHG